MNFIEYFSNLFCKKGTNFFCVHLNPKIGADWEHRGEQRKVPTPGQNKKDYLAGALHGQTGQIVYACCERKTSDLFIALLEKLEGRYRRAKSIRLIGNNYIIHKSKKTQKWLSDNPKWKLRTKLVRLSVSERDAK